MAITPVSSSTTSSSSSTSSPQHALTGASKSVSVKTAELMQIVEALETHFDRKKRKSE